MRGRLVRWSRISCCSSRSKSPLRRRIAPFDPIDAFSAPVSVICFLLIRKRYGCTHFLMWLESKVSRALHKFELPRSCSQTPLFLGLPIRECRPGDPFWTVPWRRKCNFELLLFHLGKEWRVEYLEIILCTWSSLLGGNFKAGMLKIVQMKT
jgi:hypothetical protein